YQGFTAQANIGLGKNVVVIPSYTTSGAMITSADPRFTGLDSTLILDSQIPGRPVHTGNLTVDALYAPAGLEILANAHYVGPNNNQFIAPYTLVNLGVSHAFGIGRLTLFESNVFNTESGNFSTLQYAQPIPLSGGGFLLQAARPNAPRQLTLTYSFNTGARPGAGLSRGSGSARGAQTVGAAGTQGQQQRGGLGFGQLKFIAPPPGVDPLSIATSRPECTADLKPEAEKVLAALGVAAKAYAAGRTVPPVEGLTVTPHGEPSSPTWYLGLAPNIPQSVIDKLRAQRPNTGAAAGARGPGGPGGPGGEPGGPGGPPGGFQERVTASSPDSQQRQGQFTPPPELIAALLPTRALASCAYGTVLTTTEAKAKGFDVQAGVQVAASPAPGASAAPGASPGPEARPRPAGSPAAGASPGPDGRGGGQRGRGGFGGNAFYYTPSIGLFVVRPPDLGTGGGSVTGGASGSGGSGGGGSVKQ
ncbi:MAG TPA: TonB-dependent receptor, partial [Candidatus Elarobacter sp.]|nr:TonB-dependent receptor [Candidatus Elarobacter sp.]